MTQEKELLLKDLCARLRYGVMINYPLWDEERYNARLTGISEDGLVTLDVPADVVFDIQKDDLKPCLRPMSSMTEEEKIYVTQFEINNLGPIGFNWNLLVSNSYELIDWLNAHHFDYRGLIEKGLALEAPEGMYNIKTKKYD